MTFYEKYTQSTTWQDKALIMEIFHLVMSSKHDDWTVNRTARAFGVSIGLVSENLKLASIIHINPGILSIESRKEALRKVRYMDHA